MELLVVLLLVRLCGLLSPFVSFFCVLLLIPVWLLSLLEFNDVLFLLSMIVLLAIVVLLVILVFELLPALFV